MQSPARLIVPPAVEGEAHVVLVPVPHVQRARHPEPGLHLPARARLCARERACVRARAFVRARLCVRVRACARAWGGCGVGVGWVWGGLWWKGEGDSVCV